MHMFFLSTFGTKMNKIDNECVLGVLADINIFYLAFSVRGLSETDLSNVFVSYYIFT